MADEYDPDERFTLDVSGEEALRALLDVAVTDEPDDVEDDES